MNRILCGIAALLACGAAWGDGSIVRWDRIEGVTKDAAGTEVAGVYASSRGVTVGSGKAMVNFETGFVSFEVKGIAYDRHYPKTERPIGTYPDGPRMVTVVCDSSGIYGEPVVLDTEPLVLLLRIPLGRGTLSGAFLAYGAAPSIQ